MNVYVFQAALLCDECGIVAKAGREPDEDSGRYPQGPCSDGGGEADSPQHCAVCGEFLENPLTEDGEQYVREAVAEGTGNRLVLQEWRNFYDYLFPESADDGAGFMTIARVID
jgi:hypothetical protein